MHTLPLQSPLASQAGGVLAIRTNYEKALVPERGLEGPAGKPHRAITAEGARL